MFGIKRSLEMFM